MKPVVRRTLLLVTCFALGGAVGAWMAHRPLTSASLNDSSMADGGTVASSAKGAAEIDSKDNDRISRLVTALAVKNPLERSYRVYEAIGAISSSDIPKLLDQAVRLPSDMRAALRRALFTRWMQIDPTAAGEWVRPQVARAIGQNMIGDVYDLSEVWCGLAPDEALKEAGRHPFSHASGRFASQAALILTGGDHAAALDRLAGIPEPQLREKAIAATLQMWAVTEPARAFSAFSLLHNPQERANAAQSILSFWAAKDPAAALRAMDDLLPTLSNQQAEDIANDLGRSAGKNAAAWARAQSGDLRLVASDSVFSAWVAKEPLAAIEWAARENLFENPAFANGDYLRQNADAADPALRDAVLALLDSPGRTRLVTWLMGAMADAEVHSTLRALPESARDEAASNFMGRKMHSGSSEDAQALLQSMPEGAARMGAAKGIGMVLAVRFPEQVDAFLSSLGDTKERDAAANAAVTNLQPRRPEHAIAVASSIADPELRDRARAEIFRSWLWRDTGAAYAWLDRSGLSMEWKDVLRAEARER